MRAEVTEGRSLTLHRLHCSVLLIACSLLHLQCVAAAMNSTIDVCATCHSNATCIDKNGTKICICNYGFTGNGRNFCSGVAAATDSTIDVCATCHSNATCTDKGGTKICTCNYGFTGNGWNFCSDKNECRLGDKTMCGHHATCYNTFGSFYCTCGKGYTPSNNMSTFTPNDGSRCITVDCSSPPDVQNTGWHLSVNTTYGSTAMYRCAIGYVPVSGNDTSVCSAEGQWEGASLQCTAVDCGSPPSVPNAEWHPQSSTVYGSKAVYKCKDGYVLFKGEVTLICSAQGQWEGANLQCAEVDCGSPPSVPNTVWQLLSNATYGSTAVYRCEIGYVAVSGSNTSVCSARGQWEGVNLQCEAIDCGSPPDVQNTGWHLSGNNTTYGSTAEYQCVSGYVPVSGNGTSVCSAQGQWEGVSLQCTEVDCGSPPSVPNTVWQLLSNATYGSTAVYRCGIGYVAVSGSNTSVCSARGQWEGASLQCEAVDCGSPPSVPNTVWQLLSNTTYSSTAVYRCEIGYVVLSGNNTSVCSARGQWEGVSLQCEEVDCGSPPSIPNTGYHLLGNTTYGSTAVYRCETGYVTVSGNKTYQTCSARGQWEGASLQCTELDCGQPPGMQDAIMIWNKTTSFGSHVYYECKEGYYSAGGKNISVCTVKGQWEIITLICKVIDCGPPAQVPNACLPLVRNTTYRSEIKYYCKPGYRNEVGNGISVCSVTGLWEGPPLSCKEIDCGNPPTIPNALLIWNHSSKLGSAVQYTCQDGFVSVSGRNVSVCTEGGRWEEVTLSCKVKKTNLDFILFNNSCLKWKREQMQSISEDTYLFQLWGQRIYQRDFFTEELFNYTTGDISPVVCLDLQPGTNYTVNITAFTEQLSVSIQISTKVSAPPVPDIQIMIVERQLPPLILPRVAEKNGPISLYQVLVLPLHFQRTFNCNSPDISSFFGPNKENEEYITAEFVATDVEDGMAFSVGDRLYYRAYYNAPLETGKNYSFMLKAISEWDNVRRQSCVVLAQLKGLSQGVQNRTFLGVASVGVVGFLLFFCYSLAWSFKLHR